MDTGNQDELHVNRLQAYSQLTLSQCQQAFTNTNALMTLGLLATLAVLPPHVDDTLEPPINSEVANIDRGSFA